MNEDPLAGYIVEAECARQLRRSVRVLQSWRRRQVGPPFIRIGAEIYYKQDELKKWLDAGGTMKANTDERDHRTENN